MIQISTKPLLVASALFMGIVGFVSTFIPAEALIILSVADPLPAIVFIVQMLGAAYFGFGMLNWMSRAAPMGGIYSRPLATGNFLHFTMIALASWRFQPVVATGGVNLIISIIYTLFAIAFGIVLFASSGPRAKTD